MIQNLFASHRCVKRRCRMTSLNVEAVVVIRIYIYASCTLRVPRNGGRSLRECSLYEYTPARRGGRSPRANFRTCNKVVASDGRFGAQSQSPSHVFIVRVRIIYFSSNFVTRRRAVFHIAVFHRHRRAVVVIQFHSDRRSSHVEENTVSHGRRVFP